MLHDRGIIVCINVMHQRHESSSNLGSHDRGIIVCINVKHQRHESSSNLGSFFKRPNYGFFSNDQILVSDRQTDRRTDRRNKHVLGLPS